MGGFPPEYRLWGSLEVKEPDVISYSISVLLRGPENLGAPANTIKGPVKRAAQRSIEAVNGEDGDYVESYDRGHEDDD